MSDAKIAPKDTRLVWIDLEMTGLDPARHVIVEVAALVTDADLNILRTEDGDIDGVDMVVRASEDELAEMDDFVTKMHAKSGLDKEIRESTTSIEEAEEAVLRLIAKHCDPHHPAPLAGNSIATDRTFIRTYMPRLDAALHYRMVDVSTIKELSRRWHPRAYHHQPKKGLAHRALADIIESVRELEYYRASVFRTDGGPTSDEAADAQSSVTEAYQPFL